MRSKDRMPSGAVGETDWGINRPHQRPRPGRVFCKAKYGKTKRSPVDAKQRPNALGAVGETDWGINRPHQRPRPGRVFCEAKYGKTTDGGS